MILLCAVSPVDYITRHRKEKKASRRGHYFIFSTLFHCYSLFHYSSKTNYRIFQSYFGASSRNKKETQERQSASIAMRYSSERDPQLLDMRIYTRAGCYRVCFWDTQCNARNDVRKMTPTACPLSARSVSHGVSQ